MDDRRRQSRREELARNLERFRSSGRVPAVRSSSKMSAVRRSSGQLDTVRKKDVRRSSGQMRAVAESSLFSPMRPQTDAETAALRDEVLGLRRLQEAIHFLGSAPDPFALRAEILDLACSLGRMSRGFLALPTSSDKGKRRFKVKESRGLDDIRGTAEYKFLRGILNRTLERREPLLEGSICDGGILDHAESQARELQLGAVVCLPLECQGELHGAILLDDPERSEPFSAAEESLLRSFARHAALSLERQRAQGHLKRKLARVTQRGERLEGERERLEEELRRAQRRGSLTSSSGRVRKDEKAGREYRRLLEDPYAEAKSAFTKRYLRELLRRCEGDLNLAAEESELPVARLVALLDTLDVQPPARRPRRSASASASEGGSSPGRWGASVTG